MMDLNSLYEQIVAASGDSADYHAIIKSRMKLTWQRIAHLISPGSTIVEIGAGPMIVLVKELGASRAVAVDLGHKQSGLCDTFHIELRTCDLQTDDLPLEKKSVDMILLLEVIEHLCAYPNKVFDKIYDKLKPSGYLVLSTVNLLRISTRIRILLGRNPLINYFELSQDGHNHIREFVPEEIAYYLRKSGFAVEEIYRFGIPSGPPIVSMLLRLANLYPNFRNFFMVIAKK